MKKTILLIIILISSIFCLNTYKKSYNAYISNGNYKTLLYKTLLVWNDNKSFNEIKEALNTKIIDETLIDKLAFRIVAWKYYKGLMFEINK